MHVAKENFTKGARFKAGVKKDVYKTERGNL